jgi:mono/diheme cytochrome c family protein
MIRRTLPVVVLAGLMVATASAGGWGVVTIKTLPDFAEVGKPVPLAFTVLGHGVTPATRLQGAVEAVSGTQRVSAPISEGRDPGLYHASVVLPRAGEWILTIRAGYRLTLLPLTVVEPGTRPAAAITAVDRGRKLFVAKGCVTCHQNSLGTENISANVGPALVPRKYQPEFLTRMLADPAANIPPRAESPVRMPNLHLEPQEIASLVAFIDSGALTTAAR